MRIRFIAAIAVILTCLVPVHAQSVSVSLQSFIGAGLNNPDYITNAHDGSNRLFVIEQPGIISVIQPAATSRTVFLDISSRVLFGGEQGLLGLAFHPQFATNGRFFVDYTRRPDGATVIAEYGVLSSSGTAGPSENVLLVIPQPYVNHNGGMLAFGPDGYLYVGMGDGGSANDPENRAQNSFELLGKILRIDVDQQVPPPTNPYADGKAGRPEIYAIGLRNPFRFSFDRVSGQLYVGDVGQDVREEVDIVTLGGNYGWRVWEGTRCTNLGPAPCSTAGYIFPIAEYDHATNGRCSIIGGYVYRGFQQSLPYGAYIYGDYCSGEIFILQAGVASVLTRTTLNITSFGEDEAGELFVVGQGGSIFRIINPDATNSAAQGFSISGHGSASLNSAALPNPTRGYARIQGANRINGRGLPAGMAILGNRQQGVLVSETSIVASPLISAGRIYVEMGQGAKTAIAIANPNNQPVTLQFYFTDANGSDTAQGSTTVDGNHQIAAFLDEPPFNGPAALTGSFTFSSSLLVSAIGVHGFVNERNEFLNTTTPVSSITGSPAGPSTIAQFVDGGGWKTRIVLLNPSDASINGQVSVFGQNGQPLSATLNGTTASVFSYSIPPHATRELRSSGVSRNAQIGSLSVLSQSSDPQPTAFALYQYVSNGITVSETSDFSVVAAVVDSFVESQGNFAAGSADARQSAVAIANPSGTAAAEVHFELFQSNGTLVGNSSPITIPAHSQIAMFLTELPGLPMIPSSFQGVLRVVENAGGSASPGVAVTTFRGRYNERGEFLLTATPAAAEVFSTDSTELIFPHFALGAAFETQFVLFSDSGAAGTVYYFDQNGTPLNLRF